jgi:drug/metabolite transporter (DMT)-like permease
VACETVCFWPRVSLHASCISDPIQSNPVSADGIATLVAAALCLMWKLSHPMVELMLSRGELWALAYTVGLVGVSAYSLFTFANGRLPATLLTLYGIVQPLLTSLLAFAVLGETPRYSN